MARITASVHVRPNTEVSSNRFSSVVVIKIGDADVFFGQDDRAPLHELKRQVERAILLMDGPAPVVSGEDKDLEGRVTQESEATDPVAE